MGTSSQEFTGLVLEQLEGLPGFRSGPFFGGLGLKCGATQFAMIMDGALYFVVDEEARRRYEEAGSRCFSYDTKKGRVEVRKYFEVPADWLEDPARLMALARAAIEAAGAPPPKRRTPRRKPAGSMPGI